MTTSGRLEIRIALARSRFVASEDVPLEVTIRNVGERAVTVPALDDVRAPEPRFRIHGPACPEGRVVSARAAAGIAPLESSPDEIDEVTIAPGAARSEVIRLERLADLREPGRYRVEAELRWRGIEGSAPPVELEVEPLRVVAADCATGPGAGRKIEAVFFHEGAAGRALCSASFVETKPSLGKIARRSVRRNATVAPDATDLRCAIAGLGPDGVGERVAWRAWLEDATLCALAEGCEDPVRVDVGERPAGLLRPALGAPDGALEVLALSASRSAISCVRVPAPLPDGTPRPGAVAWRLDLERPLATGSAAVGPPRTPSARGLVLVFAREGALEVELWMGEAGERPRLRDAALLPGAAPIPGAAPVLAIRGDGDGTDEDVGHDEDDARARAGEATIAVPFADVDDGQRLRIARLTTPVREDGGRPALIEVSSRPAVPSALAVSLRAEPGVEPRLDWLLLLADGSFVSSSAPLRARAPARRAHTPLVLAPGSGAAYLLTIDPREGPDLDPLR